MGSRTLLSSLLLFTFAAGGCRSEPKAKPPSDGYQQVPAILEDVAASTVAIGGVEGVGHFMVLHDLVLANLDESSLKDLPVWTRDPVTRRQHLGCDVTQDSCWSKFGAEPMGGAAVALDSQLMDGFVVYARVTDRKTLIQFLKETPDQVIHLSRNKGVDRYRAGQTEVLVGAREQTTVAYFSVGQGVFAQEEAFRAWLKTPGGFEQRGDVKEAFTEFATGPRMWAFADIPALAKALGADPSDALLGEYLNRFSNAAAVVSKAGGGLRIRAGQPTATALKQVFDAPTAGLGQRYLGTPGISQVGVRVNLGELFDGVAALAPESVPGLKGQILLAKNALPVTLGIGQEEIAAALTGELAFVGRIEDQAPEDEFEGVMIAGVKDPTRCAALLEKMWTLAKQEGIELTDTQIAGRPAKQVVGDDSFVLVIDKTALFFGPPASINGVIDAKGAEGPGTANVLALDWDISTPMTAAADEEARRAYRAAVKHYDPKANPDYLQVRLVADEKGLLLRGNAVTLFAVAGGSLVAADPTERAAFVKEMQSGW